VKTEDLVNPEWMKRESDFGGRSNKPAEGDDGFVIDSLD
jgi:hypothetical protein